MDNEVIQNLIQELRRGCLSLSVMACLKEPQYGYSLVQALADKGMEIDQGTLYPLLRRLEKQGLLDSSWELAETRPRRYYTLSSSGREVLAELKKEWKALSDVTNALLSEF